MVRLGAVFLDWLMSALPSEAEGRQKCELIYCGSCGSVDHTESVQIFHDIYIYIYILYIYLGSF